MNKEEQYNKWLDNMFVSRFPDKVLQVEKICGDLHNKFKAKSNVMRIHYYEPKRHQALMQKINENPHINKELIYDILEVGEEYKKQL